MSHTMEQKWVGLSKISQQQTMYRMIRFIHNDIEVEKVSFPKL